MKVLPSAHARRKFRNCPRFAFIEQSSQSVRDRLTQSGFSGPEVFGVYENQVPEPRFYRIGFSEAGFAVAADNATFQMQYVDVAAIRMAGDSKGADDCNLQITDSAGNECDLRVDGSDAQKGTRDIYRMLMFLQAVCGKRGHVSE